ncbi:MAG: tetratricopeptide repeat protein [Candidatus Eremiobacteraeota bacterium]|nr:tetratricopeptide repeat protein [Candidatus Eremiobacteraeota bacterium]
MSDVYIGRYKVIEELGRGGMGIVYRAEDPALDRSVAIKVLPPKKLSQKKAVRRFLREARVCAKLDHSNIVKIHDIGEEEGIYHIVMELALGITLRELIEARKSVEEIDIDKMADIFLQMLRALEDAHKQKIVHRDIKPDNIKITDEGIVKVMDFGLAVLEDRHSLTEMGQVMGTIAYFSPEQAKGEPADSRADIYSLCAVFFEMLTNQLVFQATNPSEMITRHLTSPPPNPRMYNPAIPPVFANLILQCLKKNPEDRIQSTSEMLEIIEDWISQKKFSDKENARGVSQFSIPRPVESRKPFIPREEKPFAPESIEPHAEETPPVSEYDDVSPPESILEEPPPYRPPGEMPMGYEPSKPPVIPPTDFDKTEEIVTKIPVHPSDGIKRPPRKRKNKQPAVPTSGESPVASTQWMKDAESDNRWDRYQYVLDKIKKDESAMLESAAPGAIMCPRCGAENDRSRKYCHECGNLITHSQFLAQKEAQAHNLIGMELLRENKLKDASMEFQLAVEKDPYLVEAHMNLGKALGDIGEYKKARASYREVLKLNPKSTQPHTLMGDLYRLEERRDDAIYEYKEASRIEPSNISIRNQLALLYSQKGDILRAIDEYQRILTVKPDNLEAHRQLGYLLMSIGRNEEAVREFEWVLQMDPDDDTVYQVLGNLYLKVGRLRNAEEILQTSLSFNPDDPELYTQLGEIYEKQNREDLALEQLSKAVAVDESNVAARQKLADIYEKHNRVDLALEELQKASQHNPGNPELHRRMGNLFIKENKIDKALLHFEKTVEMDPSSSAELHHKLAQLYTKKDYSELSIKEYRKAVNIQPYKSEYREDLGMALYSQNHLDEAISEMRKAATLDSTNLEYHKALGIMYEEYDEYEKAVKSFQKVISLNPRDPMAQGMLGRVYAKQGLMSMAVFQYQKALQLNPESHLFHVYLGKAYSQQGRMGEAVEMFKKAIELAPGGQTARGSRVLGKAYADLGRVYLEQGDLRKAMDVLKSAEKNNPNDLKTLHYTGLLFMEQKKYDKAYKYLTSALKIQPHNSEIMRDLASLYLAREEWTLALSLARKTIMYAPAYIEGYEILSSILIKMERYSETQSFLDDAIRCCPSDADYAYWLKGGASAAQKEWEKAAEYYREAIMLNDDDWTFFKDLALAYEEMGEFGLAMNEINNAIARNPEDTFVEKLRKDLKRLRKKKRKVF